jgi:hypothetical protein
MFQAALALTPILAFAEPQASETCTPKTVYVSATPQPLTADTLADALAWGRRNSACRLVIQLEAGTYRESVELDRPVDIVSVSKTTRPVIEGSVWTNGQNSNVRGVTIRGTVDVIAGTTRLSDVRIERPSWGLLVRGGTMYATDVEVTGASQVGIHVSGKGLFDGKNVRVYDSYAAGAVFAQGARAWFQGSLFEDNRVCSVCVFDNAKLRMGKIIVRGTMGEAAGLGELDGDLNNDGGSLGDETDAADLGDPRDDLGLRPVLIPSPSSDDPHSIPQIVVDAPPSEEEEEKGEKSLLPAHYNIYAGVGATLHFSDVRSEHGEVGLGISGAAVTGERTDITENLIGLTWDDPMRGACFSEVRVFDNNVDQDFSEVGIVSSSVTDLLSTSTSVDTSHCPRLPWNI